MRISHRETRVRALLSAVVVVIAFVLVGGTARAQQDRRIEAAAKDAIKRVHGDFRASAFEDAIARLQKAIGACGTVRCSATTRAALLRDLGVMQFRLGNRNAAAASFGEAFRVDPKIEPDPKFDGPDVHAEWMAAKEDAAIFGGGQPTGDFVHTPASEQAMGTPLPVYVEYTGDQKLASVTVKYKGATSSEYKRVPLTRMGSGWGGLIPCGDVTRGVMRYYIQGFDASNSPAALSGDPKRPFLVRIRTSINGPGPNLPGQASPVACRNGECTPGTPGCGETSPGESTEEEGERCEDDAQCSGGVACVHGRCVHPHAVEESSNTYARFWVGVSGSVDITSLSSTGNACKLSSAGKPSAAGYYCTNPDGSDFPSRQSPDQNDALADGKAGTVGGGPTVGNVRVMASFDVALGPSFLLGARLGYVLNAYPGAAVKRDGAGFTTPIHLEARAGYLFGDKPLVHNGAAPYFFAAAGLAEFDAGTTIAAVQNGIPGQRIVRAWQTSGPGFIAVGAGARYAFSPRIAFLAAMKLAAAFGGSGVYPTLAPEVSIQYGF